MTCLLLLGVLTYPGVPCTIKLLYLSAKVLASPGAVGIGSHRAVSLACSYLTIPCWFAPHWYSYWVVWACVGSLVAGV